MKSLQHESGARKISEDNQTTLRARDPFVLASSLPLAFTSTMALRLVHRLQQQQNLRRNRVFRDKTNPLDVYDDVELYERFRFRRHQLLEIIDDLRDELQHHFRQHGSLATEMQVLVALRFYASGCFQILAGDTVHAHKSTVCRTIHRVSRALRNRLERWVKLPNQAEADQQKVLFYDIAGFPNVFAAVDGTHVGIQAPRENENEFVNRKGHHSINVQLVCDSNIKILNCVVKYPGSAHDARILTESQLYRDFESGQPPVTGYILGDSAYPLKEWLMTPFINTNLDASKERYNRSQSSTRQAIERCNGVLKRRFHCLKAILRYSPARAVVIIMACIVLHNMAVFYKLPDPPADDGNDDANDQFGACGGNQALSARAIRESIVRNHFHV